jgi:acetyl-CoA acetyltransferase
VAGADALVMAAPSVASEPPPIEVRAVVRSFNHDHQLGDGLETGLALTRDALWDAAGVGPQDVDLACIYDDYPAMVLAQLRDVGLMAEGDMPRFVRDVIARRKLAVNTSGGLLSAGQAGAAGGLHGLVEAVRQLQHRADGRQVPRARIAVTTGYGMVVYRYGAAAGAAVLERAA